MSATALPDLPTAELPHFSRVPRAAALWTRALAGMWILLAIFLFDRGTLLLLQYWLLQRLGLESVFWTNFRTGAVLFAAGFALFALAVAGPALAHRVDPLARRLALQLGAGVGLLAGFVLCLRTWDFLLLSGGLPFGQEDPVFGRDVSFYVFLLPAVWAAWTALATAAGLALASSILSARRVEPDAAPEGMSRAAAAFGRIATRPTRVALVGLGAVLALGVWLARYGVLLRDNEYSAIVNGAQYLDVVGFVSTVVGYWITAGCVVLGTLALARLLGALRSGLAGGAGWRGGARRAAVVLGLALLVDFGFRGAIAIRDAVFVEPNEPVIQLPYIRAHIDATREGYGLEDVEVVPFVPKRQSDPVPDVDRLLAHPTLRNAPLWPGYVSYLERVVDPQHGRRILQTRGDTMIYGPTLEVFQQRKLRTYYEFLNVDAVRYELDGETRMLVSAVRELPVLGPQEWLVYWGQRFVLFTHGLGIVAAEASRSTPEGGPVYVTGGDRIPEEDSALLDGANPRIYHGEGAGTIAFSNVRHMKEFDFPTPEGRAELVLGPEVEAGVVMDSLLKRIVLGWRSGQFFEIVFSRLIGDETRVHYDRQPIARLERVAPFLYWDTNPYAVVAEGRIVWLVNGLTTTDRFPYSKIGSLGDKSVGRTVHPEPFVATNYVRDAVKATVDAYTGQVTLYRISDDPIAASWASIYPDLFVDADSMPRDVRAHLQYPLQLMHIQFDDMYNIYHMKDPMTFFNFEDAWDDADEVLGPILDQGGAITFSFEPYHWIAEADGHPLPESDRELQFAMSMAFTPEAAKNLRAMPVAYQSGEDYGRLISLQVPKGVFVPGPEQADAAIDQEPEISEQISWWNRRGTDVIRGHTSALVVDDELLYVEPIFIRSQQNPVTQLKKVIVVFRGTARMGGTLEEALRLAVAAAAADSEAGEGS